MIKFYTKTAQTILKKSPFQWIIGWHLFLPIIIILFIFSITVGFMFPTTTHNYYNNGGLKTAAVFLGFLSFMAFILYIVRQIKYNSFRIHHHIPFAKSMMIFFSFWTITSLLSFVPFIPYHIHNWRVTQKINSITNDFENDTKVLYYGSVFFVSDYNSVPDGEIVLHDEDLKRPQRHSDVIFNNNNTVTINNINHTFGYYHYNGNPLPLNITYKEAFNRIKRFVEVAKKYDIQLLDNDEVSIFNKRKTFNKGRSTTNYSIFINTDIDENSFYEATNNYDAMMYNYKLHYNKSIELEEVLGILLLSIIFAVLLWIVISIPIADFGFSILISVVLMVFMGIISAMINLIASNDFIIRLAFYILILIIFYLAFIRKKDTRIYRVLKIVSHYSVAVFLFLIFLEIDEANLFHHREEFYVFSTLFIIGMLLSILIYKQVYKNYRLLPK